MVSLKIFKELLGKRFIPIKFKFSRQISRSLESSCIYPFKRTTENNYHYSSLNNGVCFWCGYKLIHGDVVY